MLECFLSATMQHGSDSMGKIRFSIPGYLSGVQEIIHSGAGNVCFLRRSCTSGYKHETFRLCSSNLSIKYFLVSHRNFFHFQDG